MGVYLNPGKQYFETVANSEIFVDKTEMIMHLNSLVNTLQRYVCVTRPRGFVKTMAADMICAYYDREAANRDLFKKLKLAGCAPLKNRTEELSWDVYLGRFDVIHMVMTEFFQENKTVTEAIDNMQKDRTVILIAHRLSTVINADRILFIQDGKVLAEGSHADLLQTCEPYRILTEMEG